MDVIVTIAQFKQHLKAKGYAAATIASYRKGLSQFSHYLQSCDIDDLRHVSAKVIQDYRFWYVIIHSSGKAFFPSPFHGMGSERNNRNTAVLNRGIRIPNGCGGLVTIHFRHLAIHEYQII